MRDVDFKRLADRLLRQGITARHTHRTINELRDHYDDLTDAAIGNGMDRASARRFAAENLGNMDDFVEQMAARRELKSWAFRFPRLAILVYPVVWLAVLPAAPVFAGIAHRDTVVRWGASLLCAGLVTACMLLFMRFSLLFG